MRDLIKKFILEELGGSKAEVPLEALDDASVINDVVFHSDSYTVKPLFFPGGDIGRLAISGTINDVAVMGAEPIALSAGFVLEEGFPIEDLKKILKSMSQTCKEAGTFVITGDTKVVEKGSLDQFIINTSGIGVRSDSLERNLKEVRKYRKLDARWLLDSNVRGGDKIIVSGTIGDHGVAILSSREGYGFESEVPSDTAPLNKLIMRLLDVGGIVAIKDPTRGGLANTLNEWSEKSAVGMIVREDDIPIREGVRGACEMIGIDPLQIGNEGKIVIAVVPQKAVDVLGALRETKEGRDARMIGEATSDFREVLLETSAGGRRIIAPPSGDPIPRIC